MADQIIGALCECTFKVLLGPICECICQNLGPALGAFAECMFSCVRAGCIPMMEFVCYCMSTTRWYGSGTRNGDVFSGCFYIFLGLLLATFVTGSLGMGIYALSQYVQDFNPTVAAGVACAILDQQVTGLSFSAQPVTFGRKKGLNVVGTLSLAPITVYNRCFNNNEGSAKFYVNDQYSAYTKIDKNLYTCTGNLTYQFRYGSTLRVLNADNSLLASTDKIPSKDSTTTFKDANNFPVATLAPSATGSGIDIRIIGSNSPAAAPLVLLAAAAFAQFTSGGYDECNGFVVAGGIVDIIVLSLIAVFVVYIAVQCYRKREDLQKTKFYEPTVVVEPPTLASKGFGSEDGNMNFPPKLPTNAGGQRDYAGASAPPLPPVPYQSFPSNQPKAAAASDKIGLLFQEEEDFKKQEVAVPQSLFSDSAPSAASAMSAAVQHTPSHIDLREALKPVGYTRLKRYLMLHNVTVGHTLLKDELITLAIIYRGQIDFSPLVAEVQNVFTQQAR